MGFLPTGHGGAAFAKPVGHRSVTATRFGQPAASPPPFESKRQQICETELSNANESAIENDGGKTAAAGQQCGWPATTRPVGQWQTVGQCRRLVC